MKIKNQWAELTPEEKRAFVERHAQPGVSASKIAALIPGATRNSIIGCSHRHGIKLSGIGGVPRSEKKGQDQPVDKQDCGQQKTAPIWKPKPRKRLELNPTMDYTVSMLEVTNDQCRAPLWGDDKPAEYLMCGKPVKIGGIYCPACHAKFYHKPVRGRNREEEQRR